MAKTHKPELFELNNGTMAVKISNFCATITSLSVPDKDGKLADVVLGFDSLEPYLKGLSPYFGCIVGRWQTESKMGSLPSMEWSTLCQSINPPIVSMLHIQFLGVIANDMISFFRIKETKIYFPSRNDPEAVELCYSDIKCLSPETYLSSTIMNFYIQYLQQQGSLIEGARGSYHFFNTNFYQKLKEAVSRKVILGVGFGISKPEHVKQIAGWGAASVIVGSAAVKILGEAKSLEEGLKPMASL